MTRAPGSKLKWFGPFTSHRLDAEVRIGVKGAERCELRDAKVVAIVTARVELPRGHRFDFEIEVSPSYELKSLPVARKALAYFEAHPEIRPGQRSNGRKPQGWAAA